MPLNSCSLSRALLAAMLLLGALSCSERSSQKPAQVATDGKPKPWYTIGGMFPGSNPPNFEEELPEDPQRVADLIARGGYLVHAVAACGFCHTGSSGALEGGMLVRDSSGSGAAANITPDVSTGIGSWSVDEIIAAFRSNIRPDGTPLAAEVHAGYRWMSNADARAIAAYLLASKPVAHSVERGERSFGLFESRSRLAGYTPAQDATQASVGYGRYLVLAVAGCQRCHSPKDDTDDADEILRGGAKLKQLGVLKRLEGIILRGRDEAQDVEVPEELLSSASRRPAAVAAAARGLEEVVEVPPGAPNIRGSEGLSSWSEKDILQFLKSGVSADGVHISADDCPWDHYQSMSRKDMLAVAAFLKSF